MNIAEMIEKERIIKAEAAEAKNREKLKRQIAIFNKEKYIFKRKTQHVINTQQTSLKLLDTEKMTELENYLSVRSRTTELLYKRQEEVVRDLVKSTDVVKELLENEIADTQDIEHKIAKLEDETLDVKKATSQLKKEQAKLCVPSPYKMDNRVEHASRQFHIQMKKNQELETAINDALIHRELFMAEEKKLQKAVNMVTEDVLVILNETGDIYEKRDRAEGTKVKVKEHLNKLKDRYERELLSISLQLNEDKKMESFMRTKHKDTTQYLRDMREKEIQQVNLMMRTKDIYTRAFDDILAKTGKKNMDVIVHDFIEAEEENFAIFQGIGELLDANQEMKIQIAAILDQNVKMEDKRLNVDHETNSKIEWSRRAVRDLKWKSKRCEQRIQANNEHLTSFCTVLEPLVKFLKIRPETLPDWMSKEGKIKPEHVTDVMTAIEKVIGFIYQDFNMVELATRSLKTWESGNTPDEDMLCRVPSARILPREAPKAMRVSLLKEKEEFNNMSLVKAIEEEEMKDIVVKNMLSERADEEGYSSQRSDQSDTHTE